MLLFLYNHPLLFLAHINILIYTILNILIFPFRGICNDSFCTFVLLLIRAYFNYEGGGARIFMVYSSAFRLIFYWFHKRTNIKSEHFKWRICFVLSFLYLSNYLCFFAKLWSPCRTASIFYSVTVVIHDLKSGKGVFFLCSFFLYFTMTIICN